MKVDVLVCGAGPVGLFFAYQMASRGHTVYICDYKQGPTSQSRAILVSSRTLEMMEARGLAGDMLSEAFISSGIRSITSGSVIGQVEACGDTAFPHMTILVQQKTEEIIYDRLKTICDVHWKTELVSFTQTDSNVVSIVKDLNTNQEITIESKYIIGADGAHSKVRKGVSDWTFEGSIMKTKFFVADLSVDGEKINEMRDTTNSFMKGSKVMGLVRIMNKSNKNTFRVFGNIESYQGTDQERPNSHGLDKENSPPTLEFLQKYMDEMTFPLKFQASNVIWASYYKINERIVNGYRRDRAFLMGDAAHCHAPAGGQGMNLGLQDADNLAWKLSEILRGNVKDSELLLNSYSEERLPHAKSVIQATGGGTKVGIMDNPIVSAIRTAFVYAAFKLPSLRTFVFKTVMQHFVSIDPRVSKILGTSDKGLIQAGQFLPETSPFRHSYIGHDKKMPRIQRSTIRDILVGNDRYVAILVITCPSGVQPNTGLIKKLYQDTKDYPIKRVVIQSAWHVHGMREFPEYVTEQEAEADFYSEERIDTSTSMTQRVGLYPYLTSMFSSYPSVLLIVRPDLYVAHSKFVKTDQDLEKALEFFSNFFK